MAASTNTMNYAPPNRVRMAYFGAGAFALLAIGFALANPLRMPLGNSGDSFAILAHLGFWAALGYLFATACANFWHGRHLNRVPTSVRTTLLVSTAHLVVLLVSGISMLRGLRSRTLLADLEEIVSAVAVVSLLCLILEAVYFLTERRDNVAHGNLRPSLMRYWPRLLQAILGLATGVSLAYLESLPLPNVRTDIGGTHAARADAKSVL